MKQSNLLCLTMCVFGLMMDQAGQETDDVCSLRWTSCSAVCKNMNSSLFGNETLSDDWSTRTFLIVLDFAYYSKFCVINIIDSISLQTSTMRKFVSMTAMISDYNGQVKFH